jgi:hypothetical protein
MLKLPKLLTIKKLDFIRRMLVEMWLIAYYCPSIQTQNYKPY